MLNRLLKAAGHKLSGPDRDTTERGLVCQFHAPEQCPFAWVSVNVFVDLVVNFCQFILHESSHYESLYTRIVWTSNSADKQINVTGRGGL
jgi:hypothetical protein